MPCAGAGEQLKQLELLAVVRARGIAVLRADAAVLLGDQIVGRQPFLLAVAPVPARLCVEAFSKRIGETVGQCLHHDRVVVVVILFEPPNELVGADARRRQTSRGSRGQPSRAAR